MSFLYDGKCFSTQTGLHTYIGSLCPPAVGEYSLTCRGQLSNVVMDYHHIPTNTDTQYILVPEQVSCDAVQQDILDSQIELFWALSSILIAGAVSRYLIKLFMDSRN